MQLSLKWKIQLWFLLILSVVLIALGASFYRYEKARRLAGLDVELDLHLEPLLETLTHKRRPRSGPPGGRQNSEERRERRARPHAEELQNSSEGAETDLGGWILKAQFEKPDPAWLKQAREKGMMWQHQLFEMRQGPKGYYAWVRSRVGREVEFKTSNFPAIPMPDHVKVGHGVYARTREGRYRELYDSSPRLEGIIGYDMMPFLKDLNRLKWQIAAVSLIIWLAVFLVGYLLVSRSIRPLFKIEKTARKIAQGELSERIPEVAPGGATELKSLAANLNETFSQLEIAFERQLRFTANASHELRTPLTALLAQIEHGLKRGRSSEEHAQILEVCKRSSERIQRITEQLIELSHYDAGKVELDWEDALLEPMLTSLAEELSPYVRHEGHELITDLAPGELRCDPFRLEQVLTNLINNAVQHNADPVIITLRNRLVGAECHLEVIDNGKGIKPENIDRLFDRFFQESASRATTNGRTNVGLGLAISQAIVGTHGGRIEVESEPHRWTVFRVILPLRSSEEAE